MGERVEEGGRQRGERPEGHGDGLRGECRERGGGRGVRVILKDAATTPRIGDIVIGIAFDADVYNHGSAFAV